MYYLSVMWKYSSLCLPSPHPTPAPNLQIRFAASAFTIDKNRRSQNLLEKKISQKENLKKCTTFEEQKGTKYIRGNVYFDIIVFSCLSSTKPCLRFPLISFAREMKVFYKSSLGNEVDFSMEL